MLISMLTYRRFDTAAEVVVRYWTVDGGTVTIARTRFDPQGPMSAQQAAVAAMRAALAVLEGRTAPRGHAQPELPLESGSDGG